VIRDRFLRALESPTGIKWTHRLPREAPVVAEDFLLELVRGKRVAHLGFVDEHLLEEKLASGRWLHIRLANAAAETVGIDIEPDGVAWALEQGYEAYVADCQDRESLAALALDPFDIVVAGEVIEHLEAPGSFLRASHELVAPGGRIVVTTPNAAALTNFAAPLLGVELIHPDHLALFSPRTLLVLLERTGWDVERIVYYQRRPKPDRATGVSGRVLALGRKGVAAALRRWPYWSDGLVVVATSRRPD
jgi:SAM-dependent methyltransferase